MKKPYETKINTVRAYEIDLDVVYAGNFVVSVLNFVS